MTNPRLPSAKEFARHMRMRANGTLGPPITNRELAELLEAAAMLLREKPERTA